MKKGVKKKAKGENSSNKEFWTKLVLWVFLIAFIGLEFYSLTTESHYKWDFIFIVGLFLAVYFIRDKVALHPFHFFLLGVFLLLHNLGTFDFYRLTVLGQEYDLWVHGYFGVVSALMLYRSYKLVGPYRGWFMYLAIIAVILGFSAFHELFEYAGAMIVGEGEGVLFVGAGDLDEWDTQKDMRNNMVGALIGLGLYWVYERSLGRKTLDQKTKNN